MKFLKLLSLFFLSTILYTGPVANAQTDIENISPNKAKSLIDKEKIQILDVRTMQEWKEDGYIKGAILVDYYSKDFNTKVGQLDKSKPVLVYCAVGGRSSKAARKLSEQGFIRVFNLDGGIYQWQQDGLYIEYPK